MQRSLWGLITVCALLGCEQRGFECGTPLPTDPDVIRRCDRPNEICVCATRSCAVQEVPRDEAEMDCSSGYRYVETPFADPDRAKQCVPVALIGTPSTRNEAAFLSSAERGLTCDPSDATPGRNDSGTEDSGDDTDAEVGL